MYIAWVASKEIVIQKELAPSENYILCINAGTIPPRTTINKSLV